MKTFIKLLILCLVVGMVSACNTNKQKQEKYNRKIYLTEEDYLEDLTAEAAKERREAPAQVESEYIFNAVPETDKGVYFFNERQQPKVPGQYSAQDYKNEKRLWKKPKRYTPEQYYGMQGGGGDEGGTGSEEDAY